jgi:3-hydroxymyristoyl/3-hydroxydecanoyl-(acyl carrier protein) dehydratase
MKTDSTAEALAPHALEPNNEASERSFGSLLHRVSTDEGQPLGLRSDNHALALIRSHHMLDAQTCRRVSIEEMYPQICVRDPYFALDLVHADGCGTVVARVPVQQPMLREIGAMAAAEAGRHLAILGSCAASQVNPREGRHYYLASDAVLKRVEPSCRQDRGPLLAWSRAEFTNKRTCTARSVLHTEDGSTLYTLDVGYSVVPAPVFEKLFADAQLDMRRRPRTAPPADGMDVTSLRQNPYARELPLGDVEIRGDVARACLERIDPEICKGHFAMYPVLPVAVVMYGLSAVAGALLASGDGRVDVPYSVKHGTIRAKNFARAGESVVFEARLIVRGATECSFACRAVASGRTLVGDMDLTLTSS